MPFETLSPNPESRRKTVDGPIAGAQVAVVAPLLIALLAGCMGPSAVFAPGDRDPARFAADQAECRTRADGEAAVAEAQAERFEGRSAAEEAGGLLGAMLAGSPAVAERVHARCMRARGYRKRPRTDAEPGR